MTRKWLYYLGGHSVINTNRDSNSGLSLQAALYQMETRYAQQEFDAQREAEHKNVVEQIEQADRETHERREAARVDSLIVRIKQVARETGFRADMALEMFNNKPRALALYYRSLMANIRKRC